MKILHIGDIHLGCTLENMRRNKEIRKALDAVCSLVREHHVEAVLLAGDIFDSSSPSTDSLEIYYCFLGELLLSGCRHVVIIAGNHDSAAFLDAPGDLLRKMNIHIVGKSDPEHPEKEVLLLRDGTGDIKACVCAVPYLRENSVRKFIPEGENTAESNRAWNEGIMFHYRQVLSLARSLRGEHTFPVIGMGHLYATGSSFASEKEDPEAAWTDSPVIGNLSPVDLTGFADGFSYMALGHIHRPQCVAGNPLWRYAGSILPMNLQEKAFVPQVILLDTENIKEIRILPIPENCYQKMCVIRGDMKQLRAALTQLRQCGENVWVKPLYTGEEVLPNWALELCREYNCSSLQILAPEVRRKESKEQKEQLLNRMKEASLARLTPEKLFLAQLEKKGEITLKEQQETLLQLFRSACAEVQENTSGKEEDPGKTSAGESMKFRRLFIRNVNSLYGDHLIDFESEEFNSGIFLISGNTGSGKSSILDAVCLALYGCTPRVGRISDTQDSVMSEGTRELACELTFSLGKTLYRAGFRHARTTRANAQKPFQTPEHKLFRNGIPVEISNNRGIREEITRLIGMNESEFTRCVLLAQGSFDAFLKSKSADRSEILKSITGSSLYTRIGMEINQSYIRTRDQFQLLENELQHIVLLLPEELETLTREHRELAGALHQLEEQTRQCSVFEELFAGVEKSLASVQEAELSLETAQKELQKSFQDRKELADGERAQHCRTAVEQFRNGKKILEDLLLNIGNLQKEYALLEKENTSSSQLFRTQEAALHTWEERYTCAQELFRKIRLLDHTLAEKNKLCIDGENTIARIRQKQKEAGNAYEKASLHWDEVQKKNLAATEYLNTHPEEALLEQKKNSWDLLLASLKKEQSLLAEEKKNLEKQRTALEQAKLQLRKAVEKEKNSAEILEQKKTLYRSLQEEEAGFLSGKTHEEIHLAWAAAEKLSAFFRGDLRREEFLTAGSPCPLCGSTLHPYCEGTASPAEDETYERTAYSLKQRLEGLRKCSTLLAAAEKEIFHLEQKYLEESVTVKHLSAQLKKSEEEYAQNCSVLQERSGENDQQQKALLREISTCLQTEEREESALLSLLRKRIEICRRAQNAVASMAEEHLRFEQASTVFRTLQAQLTDQQKNKEQEIALLKEEWTLLRQERTACFGEKSVEQEAALLEKAMAEAKESYTEAQRKAISCRERCKNVQLNRERLLQTLQKQEAECTALENELHNVLQKYDFASLQEWELLYRDPDRIQALTHAIQNTDLELKRCQTLLEERKQLCSELTSKLPAGLLREENKKNMADLREKTDRTREQLTALQVRLRQDQQSRTKQEETAKILEEKRSLLNNWKYLNDNFGSTQGPNGTDRFGRIAQGYTFRELLYFANQNLLGALRNRFTLVNDSNDPLELNVIDHYRADQERTSRNLSGGESFEVSLALALGLAEMSSISQNAKLGNVLLDEGFGTLDDQALESALELLMELKNTGGKLVGIISHVEKLKEKISAKIEVQNHSGIGTLSGAGVVTGERLYQLSGQTPGSLPGASPRRKRRKNSPSAEE